MPDWITIREAEATSGYHPEHIRDLLRRGKVKARKVSIVWLVDRASLLAHIRNVEKLGAKRGPKKKGG